MGYPSVTSLTFSFEGDTLFAAEGELRQAVIFDSRAGTRGTSLLITYPI